MRALIAVLAVVLVVAVAWVSFRSTPPPENAGSRPSSSSENASGEEPEAAPAPEGPPSIAGTLISEEDGRPVPGLTVSALVAGADPLTGAVRATSDASGGYAIHGLPAGLAVVFAHGDGWVSRGNATTTGVVLDGVVVEISGTGTVRRDLVVARAATVAGRVVDHRGEPVAGVPVVALPSKSHAGREESERLLGTMRSEAASATTDAGGRFTLAALLPGRRFVFEARPGGTPQAHSGPHLVLADRPLEIVIRLPPERRLQVRVVRTDDGEPIEDARVHLLIQEGVPYLRHRRRDPWRTDAAGTARVGPLPAGPLQLRVEHPEHLRTHLPVDVPEGAESLLVRLTPGPALAGHVVAPEGTAIEQGGVTVTSLTAIRHVSDSIQEHADLGPDGAFRFGGLYPARYHVSAWARVGARRLVAKCEAAAGREDLVLTLEARDEAPAPVREGTLVVRVLGPGGAPIDEARVAVWSFDPRLGVQRETSVEARGDGEFRVSLRHGVGHAGTRRWIEVWNARGVSGVLGATVEGPFTEDVRETTVVLRAEVALEGVVRDAEGRGVPGVAVLARTSKAGGAAWTGGPMIHGRAVTGPDGDFRIGGLMPVEYDLETRPPAPFGAPEPRPVVPGFGRPEIVLARGVSAIVTVLDEAGRPVVDAWVRAGKRRGRTDVEGRVLLAGLAPAARVRLGVHHDHPGHGYASIEDWEPADTTVTLPRTWFVRGVVESGRPASAPRPAPLAPERRAGVAA